MTAQAELNPAGAAEQAAPLLNVNNVEVIYNHVILVLKGVSLAVPEGGIVALLGANGAGKTTTLKAISNLLHAERGEVTKGSIEAMGERIDALSPNELVRRGIIQVMEGRHCFEHLTVEENLLMGGYAKENTDESYQEAERIFEKYERLRNRRNQPAKVLSGGERRLLEISRALVMKPSVLLVDEPSIGLEPRYIDMVFEILRDLQQTEKKTIILVEQNAKKGLEFADIGYVLVSGQTAIAGKGDDLLKNPDVGRLFLGG